ncbi:hypothetical protein QBW33_13290 [Streptomyces sp. B21-104]|uniref:hypothetical protein n=1 Tax=Streptomyces sp. B21-104 TaxID=3039421 RepID=UPI0030D1BF8C
MSPTPTNPTPAPIDCAEPGCTWAVRGTPDKYARILAADHAAEHGAKPAPAGVWSDGDPLMEAIAAAVYDQCETHPEQALTVDDPRNIAAVAATVARRVLGTPTTNTETRSCGSTQPHQPHQFMRMDVVFQCPGAPAAPLPVVWTVWREDEPVYAHYTTEDDAKQGTIDCWQEDEPSCPDYSWRQDGPRLELVVGGEFGGVYASRHRVYGAPPAPADLPAVLREVADDLTALAAPDSERGAGVRWAADHLRHKADQVDTGGDDEVDDTLHACPDRWAGPNCRCFDADTVEQPDEQPLTAAQREYVTAQYDLFQLAAHGHYTYAPLHDRKTGAYLSTQQIKAGQQDYNDRLRAAQARSEAATIRAAAEWLRTEYPGPDLDAHIRRAADALDRYAALPAP